MDANKYLGYFVAIVVLVAIVSATGGTLLSNISGLNTTFADTGIGSLFSATIFGVILVAAIFYAMWKGTSGMKK